MILLLDNYDSFSYNLVQLCGQINPDIHIARNDKITLDEIRRLKPSHIILSPGPGYPDKAGICEDAVKAFSDTVPMLGVCLGHQAICEVFGASIVPAAQLMHGKQSEITLQKCPLFEGMPDKMQAARYHSLVAKRDTIPKELKIVAEESGGEVMAVKLRGRPVYGLQFHPESILTPLGAKILENFLRL